MANENIISYATRILCSNLGAMDYNNLRKKLRKRFDPSDDDLRYILWNCCRFSIVQRARDCSPGSELSPDSKIIAKTAVRLCKSYPKDDCKACEGLHLCKYFVYGNCRFGKGRKQCRYSHDLSSDHNYNVLKAYHLTELHEDELFLLLLQNDPSLLPEVCVHYNKGTGPYGACTFKASCTKLHICHHFVQGDCIFGSKCKRLHGIDADGRKLLEDRGLSGEIIHDLPLLYTNIYDLKNNSNNRINDRIQQTSTENSSNNEICLHYLRRLCSFQENCIRVHFHLPYKWEVYDGSAWKDLPNMEDIEMAYCNPENNRSDGSPQVDFMNMKCDSCPVRRLSTPSSVTKPPHYILTTEWIWYYKSSKGRWTEYGKTDEKQKVHSLTSKELEEAFLGENMGEIEVSKGHRQYIISFKDMYQRNPKYNTKRKVQRRPRFTSAQDVESRITIKSNSVIHSSTSTIFPDHWDKESLPESGYKLIQLSCTSEEFKRIKDLFTKTMHLETIRGIQRIQNQSLWETFQWQKEQMQKKNGGRNTEEKLLFHGTEKAYTETICNQNFDWRICGTHGTSYGKGSYFASDAIYSHQFSKQENGSRAMFVARVLVGEMVKGNESYVHPPLKEGMKTTYGSCVDNEDNPSIFVIFDKHQIYPEYLVEYDAASFLLI
ncbi:protein mono-ADP-ribosyltransferase PARP12-like isoform X2 [Polypterus senegalus]|uniref:protein mono-ADP-ribosyltransferase PARP12-like isoform X2 n=1 Tax=Polypterus senegalus TaxID=55291 RepID=UPI0019654E82|nr:protein mono-ADP-ribosyltransferase PARP12-like isoform X2 [Polypterus senegalus]